MDWQEVEGTPTHWMLPPSPPIPDDMTPWDGTKEGPPEDWDNAWKVLHRNGVMGMVNSMSARFWRYEDDELDILAYRPKRG